MPRLSNSVPKYRKHRASGQAIVTLSGTDHYLGPHITRASRVEYDRLIGEWLASGRSPSFGTASAQLTVVELLAAYVQHARKYYGPAARGEFANMKRAIKPLKDLYGRRPAAEFGPLELMAVRQTFIAAGGSRTYVNATVRRVIRIFRWVVSEGLIPPAVPQALAMVPGLRKGRSEAPETEPVRPVDAKLVEDTLPHLSPVVSAMVRLQLLTGARPGEICKPKPAVVDRSHDVWLARPVIGKATSSHLKRKIISEGIGHVVGAS
jgi:integrase